MSWLRNRLHVKMNKAGAEGAAGGTGAAGGSGTLLAGNNGGGGAGTPPGSTTTQSPATPPGTSTGAGDKGAGAQGGQNTDWRSILPDEIREDAALKVVHDIPSLAKMYIHSQKMVGAEKLAIPGKHATADDWKIVYEKLGLPKEVKDYAVKMEGASIDAKFVEGFKEIAHKSGVLPQQAQAVADWFMGINKESEETVLKEYQARLKADVDGLKKEWGAAFDQNLARAERVLNEVGNPELKEYLTKSGLAQDVRIVKLLHSIHDKFMKEDTVVGGGGPAPKFTPNEARNQANQILGNMDHPYYKNDHPGHKAAVAEVAELFAMANVGTKKV